MKTIEQYLELAKVPKELHAEAIASLAVAELDAQGLTWHKLKTRLFKAGKLAKLMTWESERLIDVAPQHAASDVAPMQNISLLGDFLPWKGDPAKDQLTSGQFLNRDPSSAEYALGVAINKWTKGHHVRSYESHKGAIRRNGGEYEAWSRGEPVDKSRYHEPYVSDDGTVKVFRNGNVWQIVATDRKWKIIPMKLRIGYEIDNVLGKADGSDEIIHYWIPLIGYELRAPVTWSVLPGK